MKRKVISLCLLLTLVLSCFACVRVDATVKVHTDGTYDVRLLYAVNSTIQGLRGGDSLELSEEEIKEYNEKGVTYEAYADEKTGYAGYILTKEGIKAETSQSNKTGMESLMDGDFITIDGNHAVLRIVPFSESDYPESSYVFSAIKEYDGYMRLNLELPVKPIKHNATSVYDDGKTLTWDLTTLKANDEVYAEFDLPTGSILAWLLPIIVAFVIAAIAVVVIIIRKRKNRASCEPSVEEVHDEPIAE